MTVPEAGRRRVLERLEPDPKRAELRQVASFDTPGPGAQTAPAPHQTKTRTALDLLTRERMV